MTSPFSLEGKTALVTGGNQGLGKAFAFGLAEAGARVAIAGRSEQRNAAVVAEAGRAGHEFLAIAADVTDDAQVAEMMGSAIDGLGRVDVWVNNAGTCFHNPSFDVTGKEWDAVWDLNVRASWKASIAAGTHMRELGGGSIVNIGSMSGLIVNRPQWSRPTTPRRQRCTTSRVAAVEWAPYNIRVNAVAPGYVKTEMALVDRPEFQRYWVEDAPQQRFAVPEEIAPSVVFLASDASSFVTGSILVVDGGYTAV